MDGQIVDPLANRLLVEGWYRRHPEIDDERIERPLIGLGLPRTEFCDTAQEIGAEVIAKLDGAGRGG